MKNICDAFPISEEEFVDLSVKFKDLCYFAAWELTRKNTGNNHQNDIEDFQQDLLISVLRAGSYYKRQIYINQCFDICFKYCDDEFEFELLTSLKELWDNRTRHGANRQKFGPHQEELLDKLVRRFVPKNERPKRKARMSINPTFATYCKQIIWNAQRSLGKKITREKPLRTGLVSLSEFDFPSLQI